MNTPKDASLAAPALAPSEEYAARLRALEDQAARLEATNNRVGTARLFLGIAFLIAAGFSLFGSAFSPAWLLVPVLVFGCFVLYHARVRRRLSRAQRGVDFYRVGLARVEDRWMGTSERSERFSDPHHIYSADLDLFGAAGLFELLCSARTRMGEDTLARWLLAPAKREEIAARQQAIAEIRALLDLREELAVIGEQSTAGVKPDALLSWAGSPNRLQQKWIKWVIRGLAIAFVGAVVLWYGTGLLSPLLVVLVIEVCCAYAFKRQLRETIHAAENTFENLDLLANFLAILERQRFSARWLLDRVHGLRSRDVEASRAIGTLRTIVQVIESRRNPFVAMLDVPLMISVQAAVAAEAWRRDYRHAVATWLDVVGEFEALASLAAYSYEHPADPFPEWTDGGPAFRARGIAHPLIPTRKAVDNDVEVDEGTGLLLVSGSNMSGKSTLLRAVGVNTVLAMAGAPVRAQRLEMTPLQVGASIRINDSLREGSSRFYAEIVRLRQIFALSGQSTPLLVLLDELLQGTNSTDRRIGAQGIVRALARNGAIGLVTTHDLALAEIDSRDGVRITNVHFQDEIEDGQMKFDYKLRPGVVIKSNALELMRAIGLEV
jgi:hypothetical protein